MIIIQSQAEERLNETLDAIKPNLGIKRCMWLELSKHPEFSLPLLQAVASEACRIFAKSDYLLFVLEQRGLVIIGDGISSEQQKALHHAIETSLDIALSDEQINLYEFRINFGKIALMTEELVQQKQKRIRKAQKIEAKEQRKKILEMQFDPEVLERMRNKRSRRTQIEIMVVEDDMFSRKMVRHALSKHYSTTVAENGYTALTTYVSTAPDIIFLDIELPDINGHEICAKLMEIDSDAYVVMLSGNGDRKNITRAIGEGAKGFVGKPFSKDKLIEYIEKCPNNQKIV